MWARARRVGLGQGWLLPTRSSKPKARLWEFWVWFLALWAGLESASGLEGLSCIMRRASESVKAGGTIRAILWYQGESGTVNRADAKGYKGSFVRLITDLHSDLKSPNLPVIQVALASGEGQFIDIVRKAQLETKLPNVNCVDAEGLPLKPDNLHLTTISEVHLGIKLANSFLASFG